VQKLMMPSLIWWLFFDAFSDHACVFLCVSMHLEAELLTHEEIPTQCGMAMQEWMTTQYDQASDTCMANGPNMRDNPTAHSTQPSLPTSQALVPCARQPGFRARYKPFFSLQSLRCSRQDMCSEKHYTSPSFVRTTHESESVGQLGQNITSIELNSNSREKWRKCISVTGSLRGQAQVRLIDKLDEACTNADDRMMLVQHCSGDRVMS